MFTMDDINYYCKYRLQGKKNIIQRTVKNHSLPPSKLLQYSLCCLGGISKVNPNIFDLRDYIVLPF